MFGRFSRFALNTNQKINLAYTQTHENRMKTFMIYFRDNFSHITPQISSKEIEDFLSQDHIKGKELHQKADLFADFLLSQDLALVQE